MMGMGIKKAGTGKYPGRDFYENKEKGGE